MSRFGSSTAAGAVKVGCPLYPQKLTLVRGISVSAMGQYNSGLMHRSKSARICRALHGHLRRLIKGRESSATFAPICRKPKAEIKSQ